MAPASLAPRWPAPPSGPLPAPRIRGTWKQPAPVRSVPRQRPSRPAAQTEAERAHRGCDRSSPAVATMGAAWPCRACAELAPHARNLGDRPQESASKSLGLSNLSRREEWLPDEYDFGAIRLECF